MTRTNGQDFDRNNRIDRINGIFLKILSAFILLSCQNNFLVPSYPGYERDKKRNGRLDATRFGIRSHAACEDQCPPTFRRPLAARERTSTSAIAMTT